MKYIISESRLDDLIYDYLSSNLQPDYGWEERESYKREKFHNLPVPSYITFDFNVRTAFKYYYTSDKPLIENPKTLLVEDWIVERLSELFGDRWEPIFVKWFQDNTGLPVNHVVHI